MRSIETHLWLAILKTIILSTDRSQGSKAVEYLKSNQNSRSKNCPIRRTLILFLNRGNVLKDLIKLIILGSISEQRICQANTRKRDANNVNVNDVNVNVVQ